MKYKIIVLMISALFLINIVVVANPKSNNLKENKSKTLDDPVPTWNEGNSWTYTINNLIIDYQYNEIKILMNGKIDDFKWTVADISSTDYIIDFDGEITIDSFTINMPFSSSILNITGSIKPSWTSLSGSIVFTKTDLELKDLNVEIKGLAIATISPIPFPIPIPFKITMDSNLSTIFPLFDFPLSDDKYWSLPEIDIKANMNIGGYFGFINYPLSITTSYSWIPFAFHCKPKVEVDVEAGTYDAYEIESTFFEFFKYYYAPSVGNIVKVDATMPNGEIHGELKSTNFI